jgi:hypothetical protein
MDYFTFALGVVWAAAQGASCAAVPATSSGEQRRDAPKSPQTLWAARPSDRLGRYGSLIGINQTALSAPSIRPFGRAAQVRNSP